MCASISFDLNAPYQKVHSVIQQLNDMDEKEIKKLKKEGLLMIIQKSAMVEDAQASTELPKCLSSFGRKIHHMKSEQTAILLTWLFCRKNELRIEDAVLIPLFERMDLIFLQSVLKKDGKETFNGIGKDGQALLDRCTTPLRKKKYLRKGINTVGFTAQQIQTFNHYADLSSQAVPFDAEWEAELARILAKRNDEGIAKVRVRWMKMYIRNTRKSAVGLADAEIRLAKKDKHLQFITQIDLEVLASQSDAKARKAVIERIVEYHNQLLFEIPSCAGPNPRFLTDESPYTEMEMKFYRFLLSEAEEEIFSHNDKFERHQQIVRKRLEEEIGFFEAKRELIHSLFSANRSPPLERLEKYFQVCPASYFLTAQNDASVQNKWAQSDRAIQRADYVARDFLELYRLQNKVSNLTLGMLLWSRRVEQQLNPDVITAIDYAKLNPVFDLIQSKEQ